MKKTLAMAAALLISCSAVSMNVFAAETDSATVYVTVSDGEKSLLSLKSL